MQFLPCTLPALFAVAAMTMAVAADRVTIAESRHDGMLTLDGTTTTVVLETRASFADALQADRAARQLYLVIENLRAQDGVDATFEVYLGLPPGVTPRRDDAHYVGDFNFFDAEAGGRAASFNISSRVAALRALAARREAPAVTIVRNGRVSPQARPGIGKVTLVAAGG